MKTLVAILLAWVLVSSAVVPQAAADLGLPSTTGLVVSSSDIASDLGAHVLARGGNAVDAAVATAFAMAVTYPFAGNIGGGGFMLVRTPAGRASVFEYREKAPAKSTPTMYLDKDGNIDMSLTRAGYLAPGVPGTVRGMALAHKTFGKLPWKDVVEPAAMLAERGFVISPSLASSLNREIAGAMKPFEASIAAYGRHDGKPWTAGDRLVLPDLARTLHAIARDGADVFYTGWIADRIAADMAAHGGIITKSDLAAYQAKARTPVTGTFLGHQIVSVPPPSGGGVTLIEMLNMLEALEIQKQPGRSATAIHLMIEAMKRAYLDRARFLGDPDFGPVPVSWLISKPHARNLVKTIDPVKASSSVDLGADILSAPITHEPADTTHFSVLDKNGMAVSNTYTLEGGYGSHVVISGTGVLLNNEMGDFNKKPDWTDLTGTIGTPPNLIAPGKRMLSSMTPTMVAKDGKLVLITGSPGSRTIINTVMGIVLDVVAWGRTGREAVDAPRMHQEWLPDRLTIEGDGVESAIGAALKSAGHEVLVQGRQGSAQSIWIDIKTGIAYGVADHRDSTAKAGKPGS